VADLPGLQVVTPVASGRRRWHEARARLSRQSEAQDTEVDRSSDST